MPQEMRYGRCLLPIRLKQKTQENAYTLYKMGLRRILLTMLPALAAAAVCGSCISESGETSAETTLVSAGDTAPDFTVEMTDGSNVTLSHLRGRIVLLGFWSPDCPMCQDEMRAVQHDVIDRIEGTDIRYLPVARDGSRDVIEEFCRQNGCEFAVGLDPDRSIYMLYATSFVPRMFVIDRDGIVRASYVEYGTDRLSEIVSAAEALP